MTTLDQLDQTSFIAHLAPFNQLPAAELARLTAALKVVFNAEHEQLLAWSDVALNQCREVFDQSVQARRLYDWYASLAQRQ